MMEHVTCVSVRWYFKAVCSSAWHFMTVILLWCDGVCSVCVTCVFLAMCS